MVKGGNFLAYLIGVFPCLRLHLSCKLSILRQNLIKHNQDLICSSES